MIGTKLAHYEITSHLGTGGMGEVYQATDSKLGRSVAVKLLPEAFTHDADRVARFEREARVLASLNHPNIAAIYGLEKSGDRKFLVMELVAGETLAERIARGALPLEDALRITIQITEALEAAHEKGIVHRDLKPANVKLTADGRLKLLDFGLAKAMSEAQDGIGPQHLTTYPSNSPTMVSMGATNAGVILGTAPYMSPEQAKGLQIDRKTDIFALGCVLFEMLTGRPAFQGDSAAQILARVLERDPEFNLLPARVPPRIRELLELCLEKNPKERRSDASDVRIDIERAMQQPPEESGAAKTRPRGGLFGWSAAAVFALIAAALLIAALLPSAQPPLMRVEINTPPSSLPQQFALSPDGRSIVFVASDNGPQRLWIRPLDQVKAEPLAGTDDATLPFWSPDSRAIGFFASGALRRIDAAGGPTQHLASAALPRGGTWNADGVILYAAGNVGPLRRIAATGGESTEVTKLTENVVSHRFPHFLPDGKHFLFFVQGSPEIQGIYFGSLDGTATSRLTPADTAGVYLQPDRIVFIRQGALVAQRLDSSAGSLIGDSEILANPAGYDANLFLGAFSVSSNGTVAYRTGGAEERQLAWFDRSGRLLNAVGNPDAGSLVYPEISPNGHRLAVDRTVQNNRDVWMIDLLKEGKTRLTFDGSLDETPVWSPDGSQLAFASARKGTLDLFLKSASGAGADQLLLERPAIQIPLDWSNDGQYLLYFNTNPNGVGPDLWALPMSGENRKPFAIAATEALEQAGVFSPDSRWVAYHTNQSGRLEVVVQPFPNLDGRWQISTGGGSYPRWSRNGKELYFLSAEGDLMAASISAAGNSFEASPPKPLFRPRIVSPGAGVAKPEYDVSEDGRFLINQRVDSATTNPITLILNWRPAR